MKEVMKSSREIIFDEILKNPYITNKEIEKLTGFNENLVKVTVHRLKKIGMIDSKNENGKREFIILDSFLNQNEKKALYEDMIDIYMNDFVSASTFEDRLKVGREIRLLIEKL